MWKCFLNSLEFLLYSNSNKMFIHPKLQHREQQARRRLPWIQHKELAESFYKLCSVNQQITNPSWGQSSATHGDSAHKDRRLWYPALSRQSVKFHSLLCQRCGLNNALGSACWLMRCYTAASCQQEGALEICKIALRIIRNVIPGFDRCSRIPEPPPGLLSDSGGPGQPGICWFEGDTATKGKEFDGQSKQQTSRTKQSIW